MKQYLPPHHHVLNAYRLGAGWVLMCKAGMVLMPVRHGPQSSFHAGMPVAEQLWQAAQRDQVRIFRIGFRYALCRHPILQHRCIATHTLHMREL